MIQYRGFSLVELMIVVAIIGIMTVISSFAWQQYVNNTNLKTAALAIISDIQNCKVKARSESTNYLISFNQPANNGYQICTTTDCLTCSGAATTKRLEDYGSGITIDNVGFPGNNMCLYMRGTADPGSIRFKNSRNSIITVTVNIIGKSYVNPDHAKTAMQ